MKFYFCEGCGKRLTEHQVAQGQARDKKLKGIFCADCAAGVLTMEFPSLTTGQARETLRAEAPPVTPVLASALEASKDRRRIASNLRPPAERRAPPERAGSHGLASGSRIAIAVVSTLLLAAVAGLLARHRASQPSSVPDRSAHLESRDGPGSAASPQPSPADAPRAHAGAHPEPAPPANRTEMPMPEASPGPVPEANAEGEPLPVVPEATASAPLPVVPNPPPQTFDAPPPGGPEADEVAAKAAQKAARGRFRELLEQVETFLKEAALERAQTAAREALATPELQALAAEGDALLAALKQLVELAHRETEKLAALVDGKTHRLLTAKGVIRGEITEAQGGVLRVRVTASVNGQPLEYSRSVPLEELTQEGREELFGRFEPGTPAEWAAAALLALAGEDLAAAERAIAAYGDAPLAALLAERVLERKLGAREVRARRDWEAAEAHFAAKRWKEASGAYAAFQAEHAGTKVHQDVQALLAQRVQNADLARVQWMQSFERGEWVSVFTALDREQWEVSNGGAWKLEDGAVAGTGTLAIRGLVLTDFELECEMRRPPVLEPEPDRQKPHAIGVILREKEEIYYRVTRARWDSCVETRIQGIGERRVWAKSGGSPHVRAVSKGAKLMVYTKALETGEWKLSYETSDVPTDAVGFRLFADEFTGAVFRNVRVRRLPAASAVKTAP